MPAGAANVLNGACTSRKAEEGVFSLPTSSPLPHSLLTSCSRCRQSSSRFQARCSASLPVGLSPSSRAVFLPCCLPALPRPQQNCTAPASSSWCFSKRRAPGSHTACRRCCRQPLPGLTSSPARRHLSPSFTHPSHTQACPQRWLPNTCAAAPSSPPRRSPSPSSPSRPSCCRSWPPLGCPAPSTTAAATAAAATCLRLLRRRSCAPSKLSCGGRSRWRAQVRGACAGAPVPAVARLHNHLQTLPPCAFRRALSQASASAARWARSCYGTWILS